MPFNLKDKRLTKWMVGSLMGSKQVVPNLNDEIIVSMSSGVDSSVTALIMSKIFPNVRGIFMANWSSDKIINGNAKCTLDEDWCQVQETCKQIGIPCSRVSFEKDYWTNVFEPMLAKYEKGYTPNPDIGCNKYVKFGKMISHLKNHFTNIASSNDNNNKKWWLVTGHYARILNNSNDFNLFRAKYKQKDQSYYLTSMPQNVLSKVLMPIGHYSKPEIREIANDYDLITKDKPDSQGLCFVSQSGKFKDFLNEYIQPKPGNIVDREGKIWGNHQGLWQATIGQKSGISMPQGDPRYKGVWFVCDKNIERNELIIARKEEDRFEFYKKNIIVDLKSWYWMSSRMDWDKLKEINLNELNCQIRSLQDPNSINKIEIDEDTQSLKIEVDMEIFGIAPGQTFTIYHHDKLLGSGQISGSSI